MKPSAGPPRGTAVPGRGPPRPAAPRSAGGCGRREPEQPGDGLWGAKFLKVTLLHVFERARRRRTPRSPASSAGLGEVANWREEKPRGSAGSTGGGTCPAPAPSTELCYGGAVLLFFFFSLRGELNIFTSSFQSLAVLQWSVKSHLAAREKLRREVTFPRSPVNHCRRAPGSRLRRLLGSPSPPPLHGCRQDVLSYRH